MSILIKPAYDADASTYFTTAGITSVAGRQQVSRFVIGIKDLGLWSSMVCWPLRSTQNAGTGTTAYSLGGLITTNGTLTNGPTWGADGVIFDGTNDYITIPFTSKSSYSNFNFGGIFMTSVSTGTRIAIKAPVPWIGIQFSTIKAADDGANEISLGSYSLNSFLSANYDKNGTTNTIYRDGSSKGTFTSSVGFNTAPILIGSYATDSLFWSGTISMAYLFSASLTSLQNASLYTLYKNTLGQGLGLP